MVCSICGATGLLSDEDAKKLVLEAANRIGVGNRTLAARIEFITRLNDPVCGGEHEICERCDT